MREKTDWMLQELSQKILTWSNPCCLNVNQFPHLLFSPVLSPLPLLSSFLHLFLIYSPLSPSSLLTCIEHIHPTIILHTTKDINGVLVCTHGVIGTRTRGAATLLGLAPSEGVCQVGERQGREERWEEGREERGTREKIKVAEESKRERRYICKEGGEESSTGIEHKQMAIGSLNIL